MRRQPICKLSRISNKLIVSRNSAGEYILSMCKVEIIRRFPIGLIFKFAKTIQYLFIVPFFYATDDSFGDSVWNYTVVENLRLDEEFDRDQFPCSPYLIAFIVEVKCSSRCHNF